jgi:hypothetical protein
VKGNQRLHHEICAQKGTEPHTDQVAIKAVTDHAHEVRGNVNCHANNKISQAMREKVFISLTQSIDSWQQVHAQSVSIYHRKENDAPVTVKTRKIRQRQ